jgi:hypothetical protein
MDKFEVEALLRKTIKDLKHFLETELEYAEDIVFELEKDRSNGAGGDSESPLEEWYSNDVDDNIDYLIRDLVPQYQNQQDAVDTLVGKLKEIQEYRQKVIEGEN